MAGCLEGKDGGGPGGVGVDAEVVVAATPRTIKVHKTMTPKGGVGVRWGGWSGVGGTRRYTGKRRGISYLQFSFGMASGEEEWHQGGGWEACL